LISIAVNPPKTPVTEGSMDLAPATLPNVCKMPGPPAPFIPTPLPNIGRSGDKLKKCTKKVLFEGKKVAIKGSYYMSMGDIASKGTGGGIVSATTHGKTKFVAPGSMNVKAEGKNIQLLGDAMTNNGNKNNSGTVPGNQQAPAVAMGAGEKAFKCAVKECDYMELSKQQKADVKSAKSPCGKLGELKHECIKQKMKDRAGVQNEPSYDTGRDPAELLKRSPPNQNHACPNFYSAWASVCRNCRADGVK
jgi:uncharacterized Zn-binding protein involved in type VI secretion